MGDSATAEELSLASLRKAMVSINRLHTCPGLTRLGYNLGCSQNRDGADREPLGRGFALHGSLSRDCCAGMGDIAY
jgi:hypothetical protein